MDTYKEDSYGERFAGIYDDWYAKYDDATLETYANLLKTDAYSNLELELAALLYLCNKAVLKFMESMPRKQWLPSYEANPVERVFRSN